VLFLDWIPPSDPMLSGSSPEAESSDSIRLSLALGVPMPLRGAYTICASEPLQVIFDRERSLSFILSPGRELVIMRLGGPST